MHPTRGCGAQHAWLALLYLACNLTGENDTEREGESSSGQYKQKEREKMLRRQAPMCENKQGGVVAGGARQRQRVATPQIRHG